jgi:hypothetical protein
MTQVTTEKTINIDTCPARLSLNKDSQVSFLACADLHLRDDTPVCRTDDYQKAQTRKLDFLFDTARTLNVPVLIAGDIFDNWKPSHKLVAQVIELSKGVMVIVVPGQHDLPSHSLTLLDKSGLGVLKAHGWHVLTKGCVAVFNGITVAGYAFGETPPAGVQTTVLLWHAMNWTHTVPYPGCDAPNVSVLAKRYPKVKLILTGDNHQPFCTDRTINPGSMMRLTADQSSHRSRFYAVDNKLEFKAVYFPIEQGVISTIHLEKARERNEKMESFITSISKSTEISLSFEANMDKYFEKNKTDDAVKTMVLKSMEGE